MPENQQLLKVEEFPLKCKEEIEKFLINVDFKDDWTSYTDLECGKLEKRIKLDLKNVVGC